MAVARFLFSNPRYRGSVIAAADSALPGYGSLYVASTVLT